MVCNDGKQRTMQIPGDGIVLVDDVQYIRVFDSEQTTLPPPEEIAVDELTRSGPRRPPPKFSILQPDGADPQDGESTLPDEAPCRSREA